MYVAEIAKQLDTMSSVMLGRFDPSLKPPMCLTTLKNCDTTKQSVDDNIYIYIYIYIYICVCVCVCVCVYSYLSIYIYIYIYIYIFHWTL